MFRLIAILLIPLAAACTPLNVVDQLTPRDGYRVTLAVAYGQEPRQRYDLYQPTEPRLGSPTIVFFYGGSWQAGNRADYRFVAQAFTSAGYRVAIPDYRLYPDVTFPAFVQDAAAAVAHITRREQTPVIVMGHSAGAHLALLITLDQRYLAAENLTVTDTITAAIGLAGPYDFRPLSATMTQILAPTGDSAPSQPITAARGDAPPVLLMHGALDAIVQPGNTDRLAARLNALSGDVTVRRYSAIGHLSLIGALAGPMRFLAPVRADILAYLRRFEPQATAGFTPLAGPWDNSRQHPRPEP